MTDEMMYIKHLAECLEHRIRYSKIAEFSAMAVATARYWVDLSLCISPDSRETEPIRCVYVYCIEKNSF